MPSISKRGNSFRIAVSLGYGADGRQIRKTTTFTPPEGVTPGKAEKLALAYAYQFEQRCRGMTNMQENMRFSELLDWYNGQIAPNRLKENTLHENRKLLETYVLPAIGGLKLKDITTSTIDSMFAQLMKSGRRTELCRLRDPSLIPPGAGDSTARLAGLSPDTVRTAAAGDTVNRTSAEKIAEALGRPLAAVFTVEKHDRSLEAGTVLRIRTALSPVFSAAVKKEIITRNPVANATSPRGEKKEREFLNAEQCRRLLELLTQMPNQQNARAVETLLLTGMRVGELLSLHWDDVDLEGGFLNIRYNLYRVDGEYKLSTPKTKSSARVIAVPRQVVDTLRAQELWQDQRRTRLGRKWIDRGCVFSGEYGEYMSRNYLNATMKKFLAEHDFPDIHIHDLRHANASLLINMGVPVKVVSEHLGHSNTFITENTYAHVFDESKIKAADAITRALNNVASAQNHTQNH